MNKILFVISILSCLKSEAQTSVYYAFPDSNTTWCCFKSTGTGCCFCGIDYETYSTYLMSGHELINGNVYSVLQHYEITYDHCLQDTSIDTTTYFIRQDTVLKKVWLLITASNTDTILFDFNLSVGDTIDASKAFWAENYHAPYYSIVRSVDSILINGQYRRRFNYSPDFAPNCISSLIEGIGSTHGLMYGPPSCFEYTAVLREFIQDNQVFIGDPSIIPFVCHNFITNVSNVYQEEDLLDIIPNPLHSSSIVKVSKKFENGELKIYNSLGEQIREGKLAEQSAIFNRVNLGTGFYFLQVISKNGNSTTRKFLIE